MSQFDYVRGLSSKPDALVSCVVINNYGVPVAFTVINDDNGLVVTMTVRGTVKELTPIDPRDWSPVMRPFYADLAFAWHLFGTGVDTLPDVPFDTLTESEKEAYSAVATADYLASIPDDEERAVLAWRKVRAGSQKKTYFVERWDLGKDFNSCLVSFPCESKEEAIALAIRFSHEYGRAQLFETAGDKLTCTLFVRGKVQGIDGVGASAKE
jgi:hypothetical protein